MLKKQKYITNCHFCLLLQEHEQEDELCFCDQPAAERHLVITWREGGTGLKRAVLISQ